MKKRGTSSALVLLVTAAIIVAGCGTASKKPAPAKKPIVNPGAASMKEAPKELFTQSVALYFSNKNADKLVHETRKITAPADGMPAALVKELIRGPILSGGVQTIPGKTKLRSLRVTKRIAYADFSKEISTQLQGGSAGERMTVYSIVDSLARLGGIDKVQFLVGGKKIDSLAGHMDLTKPIAPDYSLVYVPPAANPRTPAELGEPQQPAPTKPSPPTPQPAEPAKKPGVQTYPRSTFPAAPTPQPGYAVPPSQQPSSPFTGGEQDKQGKQPGSGQNRNEKSIRE
ncbi:MAG: GerMN domain-containing protein [Candidatus Saccharibacteria bacterium]